MIEVLSGFPDKVAAFACHGKVTREEYDTVLVPVLDAKFKAHEKLRLYYEVADDFDAIGVGAVWEDIKAGMEHLMQWERIAVVTDVTWIHMTMRAFSFVIPAKMRFFPLSERGAAREWIAAA